MHSFLGLPNKLTLNANGRAQSGFQMPTNNRCDAAESVAEGRPNFLLLRFFSDLFPWQVTP